MENDQYLQAYLQRVNLTLEWPVTPSLDLLTTVLQKHLMTFPFSNFPLWKRDKRLVSLKFEDVYHRLVNQNTGGCCYENNSLLQGILLRLGFDCKTTVSQALLQDRDKFDKSAQLNHLTPIVTIGQKQYIVDSGLGLYSMREPLEFDFNNPEERHYQHTELEKYRIQPKEDGVIQLDKVVKNGEWLPCFALPVPIKFMNLQEIEQTYYNLMFKCEWTSIRDDFIVTGKITNNGRIGVVYPVKLQPFHAFITKFDETTVKQIKLGSYEEVQDAIQREIGLCLPNKEDLQDF